MTIFFWGNCRIGAFSAIDIGAFSAIDIGAVLINRIVVAEPSVVGAGSTVLKPADPYQVDYVSPAKMIRSSKAGDKYM